MTTATPPFNGARRSEKLPIANLVALGAAGFLTILTEALPAGLLPAMSADLGVTESVAGQLVTVYAIGSAAAAVPLTAATVRWPRKRLLVLALVGFVLSNATATLSTLFAVTIVARVIGGAAAGLLWGLLAGYARRLVPAHQRGRATAIAMAGTPIALSIGIPAGTSLANLIGWRWTFGIVTVLTIALIVRVIAAVPDFAGTTATERVPFRHVLRTPGIAAVLIVTLTFVLAHNLLYTYIAPLLDEYGLGYRVDLVLLIFGVAALASIGITGALIDRHLRRLMIAACALFAAATLLLGVSSGVAGLVYFSAAVWGLGFGGTATLLQTASADVAGAASDIAQSLIVTCWNIGIAAGALGGGLILTTGAASLPWWTLVFVGTALIVTIAAHRHGFPRARRSLSPRR
ncbi:MFS transporter [Microbacterium sp. ZW T5_56]|uniref:MFS transporter n=1 Tax=Microbacterium sp. ZW T5_56 TaxID=3378081 RepID=UPI0038525315